MIFDIANTHTGKRCKNCNRKLKYSDKYKDFCDDKCKEILDLKEQLKQLRKEQESTSSNLKKEDYDLFMMIKHEIEKGINNDYSSYEVADSIVSLIKEQEEEQ